MGKGRAAESQAHLQGKLMQPEQAQQALPLIAVAAAHHGKEHILLATPAREHEGGITSNRGSARHGESVPPAV